MAGPQPPSDVERELNDLRARAYGPDADIQVDPTALARLAELEAARGAGTGAHGDAELGQDAAAAVVSQAAAPDTARFPTDQEASAAPAMDETRAATSRGDSSRSLLRGFSTATRSRRIAFIAGSLMAVVILLYTVIWLLGPHPDATLRATDKSDGRIPLLIEAIGGTVDVSTLRGYEPYRDIEPWSATATDGSLCLMGVDRARTGIFGAQCVPPGTELFIHLGAWPYFDDAYADGLPDGSVIRFHLRGDEVDVFVYPASEAD